MLSICLVPNLNDLVVNTIIESWLVCTGHTSDTTYSAKNSTFSRQEIVGCAKSHVTCPG